MTLDHYRKSITTMTDEELQAHLATIRKKRRTPSKPKTRRKAAGGRKPPDPTANLKKALITLTADEQKALLALLEGTDNEPN